LQRELYEGLKSITLRGAKVEPDYSKWTDIALKEHIQEFEAENREHEQHIKLNNGHIAELQAELARREIEEALDT
jgi:hypothetical protein